MKTTNIVFLIDIQNGFAKNDLTSEQGGSLYVPGGEHVVEPAANLIRNLKNSVVVLSQDFHSANHISFASNHAGAAPFSNIALKLDSDGVYHVAQTAETGVVPQTLWLDHCIQGTKSTLFDEQIMGELPDDIQQRLHSHVADAVLSGTNNRGNKFYVIRKGTRADLDSYGIATENDGVSTTEAPATFALIADELQNKGIEKAYIYVGGLATNFCVEFSHNDIRKFLLPKLNVRGIQTDMYFLTDISAGIPDAFVPPGFEVASAMKRIAKSGTRLATTEYVIRGELSGRSPGSPAPTADA